ncbi:hypothetical protein B0H19DRAFT_1147298 [Mycena capillaripes]|nr:hypothetical protein B0H19DRAFT_1147298 [Mycena capillaripes]
MSTPQELEEVFGLLTDVRTTNSLAVASLTLVIIEHIATFKEEVNLVWKTRRSPSSIFYVRVSALFISSRTFLSDLDPLFHSFCFDWRRHFHADAGKVGPSVSRWQMNIGRGLRWRRCHSFFYAQMVTSAIIIVSTDIVLVLRVWILYSRSRRLLYFLVPLIVVEMISLITVGTSAIKSLDHYLHIGPILAGCYALGSQVPRLFTFYTIPPFVTAFIMFSMTLYKCGVAILDMGPRNTPLSSMFLRDGVFWFLALILVSIEVVIIWTKARPTLAQIPVIHSTGLIAVIGARVVLNIKHVVSNLDVGDDSETTISLPSMEFHTPIDDHIPQ